MGKMSAPKSLQYDKMLHHLHFKISNELFNGHNRRFVISGTNTFISWANKEKNPSQHRRKDLVKNKFEICDAVVRIKFAAVSHVYPCSQ